MQLSPAVCLQSPLALVHSSEKSPLWDPIKAENPVDESIELYKKEKLLFRCRSSEKKKTIAEFYCWILKQSQMKI